MKNKINNPATELQNIFETYGKKIFNTGKSSAKFLRFTPLFFLVCALMLLSVVKTSAQTKIKVHLTYTNNYCGGARPTPEIEAKTKIPQNFHDVHIILKGKMHCKAKTDSLGYFSLPLKPGIYKIHLTKLKNEAHFTTYDPSCEKMLNASYGELIVEKGKTEFEVNLHFPCNPCEPPRP